MNCKKLLLLLACHLFIYSMWGQKATLQGRVAEKENGSAIPGARVIIDASKGLATVTNMDGKYTLKLDPGKYEVTYKFTGKEEKKYIVVLKADEVKTVNMDLGERVVDFSKTVVVSGSKFAKKASEETVTIEVLRNDVLKANNITSVDQGLAKVPGVTVTENQVNIRGGSGWSYGAGSRVMVLLDDIPLLSADAGDAKWGFMPMENVEQIEVIKGAASSIYGSGALNGVVNIRTGYAKSKPETSFSYWAGYTDKPSDTSKAFWATSKQLSDKVQDNWIFRRNQPFKHGGNFLHKRKIGNVDFVIGGQFTQERTALYEEWNTDYRVTNKLRWRPKGVKNLAVGVNTTIYKSYGGAFFLWAGGDSLQRRPLENSVTVYDNWRVAIDPFVTYTDKYSNNWSYKGRYFNAANRNASGQGSLPVTYYNELQYNRFFAKSKINLVAGFVTSIGTVRPPGNNPDSLSLTGSHNILNMAPYAQIERKFIDNKLTVNVGMRFEYTKVKSLTYDVEKTSTTLKLIDKPDNELTFTDKFLNTVAKRPLFKLGLNYQLAEATHLRASLGEGYRFPSLVEFFINTKVGGGGGGPSLSIFPNQKLRPEYGWYGELGVKQGFKVGENIKGFLDVSTYINQYMNMTEFNFGKFGTSGGLGDFGFSSQNVGRTRIIGIDVSTAGTGIFPGLNTPFMYMFGYTYIDPHSLNWNDTLKLYDAKGNLIAPNPLAIKNNDPTYAGSSTSNSNVLKYRNRHMLTMDFQVSPKRWDIGASLQIRSWMENVDYAFVSEILKLAGGAPFQELEKYRSTNRYKEAIIVLDTRLQHRFRNDKLTMSYVCKNLLNKEYDVRPALLGNPRSHVLQLSYRF